MKSDGLYRIRLVADVSAVGLAGDASVEAPAPPAALPVMSYTKAVP